MTERPLAGQDQAPPPQRAQDPSAGAMLRAAREAQGMHLGALAVALRVPVKRLEALEADQHDALPDLVFVRALAATVCRTLKVEADPILAKLPQARLLRFTSDETGINIPFRTDAEGAGWSPLRQFPKPLVIAVFLLLCGVMAFVAFPFFSETEPTSVQARDTLSAPPAALVAEPSVAASAPPATVMGSGASTGTLVFKARGLSWIEVIDAGGVVQVRRNLSAGEIVGVSGVAPLSVVVGRSDVTEVQLRGEPLDLTSVSKDNVARFEVN